MLLLTCLSELDLALTYSLRRPALARACAIAALRAAVSLKRPDLAHQANEILGVLS